VTAWPDRRFLELTGARLPIVQAPMAGSSGVRMAIAALQAGAVGSLPCALLSPDQVATQVAEVRRDAAGPLNLNFFCHELGVAPDERAWRALLAPFYAAEGVAAPSGAPVLRLPFDAAMCDMVEALRPEIVSFHFGLPESTLFARVKATGARILASATIVAEARWLAERGVDAIIAQGFEAGGHAGWFLDRHRPVGLASLVRGMVATVDLPVIAAGGIADAKGMAGALTLGASAVQIGTAYLNTPESLAPPAHRALLGTDAETVFTNLLSGRAARGFVNHLMAELGAMRAEAPVFPYSSIALAPLRAHAEADGRGDYSPFWAGQSAALVRPQPAHDFTERLARDALALITGDF
jgi:nitronate monooxygenase